MFDYRDPVVGGIFEVELRGRSRIKTSLDK